MSIEAAFVSFIADKRGDGGCVQSIALVERNTRDDIHSLRNGCYRVSVDLLVRIRFQMLGYAGRALELSGAALQSAGNVTVDNRACSSFDRGEGPAVYDDKGLGC